MFYYLWCPPVSVTIKKRKKKKNGLKWAKCKCWFSTIHQIKCVIQTNELSWGVVNTGITGKAPKVLLETQHGGKKKNDNNRKGISLLLTKNSFSLSPFIKHLLCVKHCSTLQKCHFENKEKAELQYCSCLYQHSFMLEREIHKIRGNCAQPKRWKETAQHLWEHSGVLVELRSILFLKSRTDTGNGQMKS